LFPAGAGNCSQSLLGTVMKKYMEYPAGAGYSTQQGQGTEYILVHISTQQELGTDAWSTQHLLGTGHVN